MSFQKNKGLAFIVALVFVLVLALAAGSFILISSSEMRMAKRQNDSTRAFYLAEAGIEHAVAWLRAQATPPSNTQGPVAESLTTANYTGSYTFTVTPHAGNPIPNALGTYTYTIVSTGNVGDISRIVETEEDVILSTFARYSYFTSFESFLLWWWWRQFEVPVWFTTGTFLEGPVHTNDQFHISGDPIFDGPVSSVAATIDYMHGGPPSDNPQFRQGITLDAEPVDTRPLTSTNLRSAAASEGGYTFAGDTTVVLNSDGTMDVHNNSQTPAQQNDVALPSNGALFVDGGDLNISGTLSGRLTAGSSRDVVIMDDIYYNVDPRTTPTSTDILALIAERDVVIDRRAATGNPNNDLEVFASLIAIGQEPTYGDDDGSFYVENYWSQVRGVLTVYGGIIQKRRGPVGTFNPRNSQKVSGYDKDYHYDIRMDTNPPPYLPFVIVYARRSWKED